MALILCNGRPLAVHSAVSMIRGVTSVAIELDVHEVQVKGFMSAEEVTSAVEAGGYTPRLMRKLDAPAAAAPSAASAPPARAGGEHAAHMEFAALQIGGMTCAACSGAVEAALLSLGGVKSASVSLMTCNGRVEYDSRLTSVPNMVDAVVAAGYAAEPIASDEVISGPDYSKEANEWSRRFFATLPFTVPVFLLSMVLKHIPGALHHALHYQLVDGLSVVTCVLCVLTTPVQFGAGLRFHKVRASPQNLPISPQSLPRIPPRHGGTASRSAAGGTHLQQVHDLLSPSRRLPPSSFSRLLTAIHPPPNASPPVGARRHQPSRGQHGRPRLSWYATPPLLPTHHPVLTW